MFAGILISFMLFKKNTDQTAPLALERIRFVTEYFVAS